MTLRVRLIVLVAFVLLVSVLLGGMLAWWHAGQSARTEMQAALLSGEHRVRDSIEYLPEVADREGDLRRLIATFNGDRHVRAALLDKGGRSIVHSASCGSLTLMISSDEAKISCARGTTLAPAARYSL